MIRQKRIAIVRGTISPFEAKLAKALKKNGYAVSSISIYEPTKDKKTEFDSCHFLLGMESKSKQTTKMGIIYTIVMIALNIPKIIKPLSSNDIMIGVSEPNSFISFAFFLSKHMHIYFPYDIPFFRYKDYSNNLWYDRFFEKYNFTHCDKIIHKGPNDELDHLPPSFNASSKSAMQFLLYCDEDNFLNVDDPNNHLLYIGLVYHKQHPLFLPIINTFKEIIRQELFLHVYPTNYDQLVSDPEYIELQKSEYFTLHKPIYGDAFKEEIKQYGWGIYILYHDFSVLKKIWADTVFGNKLTDYLEVGIPMISNNELSFVSSIIKDNNLGIVVDKPSDIKNKINNANYEKLRGSVDVFRKSFTMSGNIDRLIIFMEERRN